MPTLEQTEWLQVVDTLEVYLVAPLVRGIIGDPRAVSSTPSGFAMARQILRDWGNQRASLAAVLLQGMAAKRAQLRHAQAAWRLHYPDADSSALDWCFKLMSDV